MARAPLVSSLILGSLLLSGCCGRTRCAPCGPPARAAEPVLVGRPAAPAPEPGAPAEAHVLVEAAYFRIPAAQADRVLGPPLATRGRSMRLLTPLETAALHDRLAKDRAVVVLNQPAIVTISGQEASIWVRESYEDGMRRPAGMDPFAAALEDPHWSGSELHLKATVLPKAGDLALDLAFVRRDPPPEGTKPDPAAILADQVHGRMGVGRMASGDSAYIVVAAGKPDAPGDRTLLLATPRILPPEPPPRSR